MVCQQFFCWPIDFQDRCQIDSLVRLGSDDEVALDGEGILTGLTLMKGTLILKRGLAFVVCRHIWSVVWLKIGVGCEMGEKRGMRSGNAL